MKPLKMTLAEVAKIVHAQIKGDADCLITGVAPLQYAQPGDVSFLHNVKYKRYLESTHASAVILNEKDITEDVQNALIVPDPYYAYAQLAAYLSDAPKASGGIHPTAVIGEDCCIDDTVSIGPNVVVGDNVRIGSGAQIQAGCVIGKDCLIGENVLLHANVTVYYGVTLGDRVVVHSGAVIGSDGFGFAPHEGVWHKVAQLGGVEIHDDVEIGANTTIDRGALRNTIIGVGVKLDNQIQIAHNVVIGEHTVVAGCVGIAGSTTIGKRCLIGGGAAFADHLQIADDVIVTGRAMITSSIAEPGVYSSGTGFMKNRDWQKNVVRFRHLDKMVKRLCALEKEFAE